MKAITSDEEYAAAQEKRRILVSKEPLEDSEEWAEVVALDALMKVYADKHYPFGVPLEPKPCPFCGLNTLTHQLDRRNGIYIGCLECKASGPYGEDLKEAISVWNKRPWL